MPLYEYKCPNNHITERMRKFSDRDNPCVCDICAENATVIYSTFHDHWGWLLTEKSHHRGTPDVWVQDKPSNDPIVFKEKYIKEGT